MSDKVIDWVFSVISVVMLLVLGWGVYEVGKFIIGGF